MTFNIFCNNLEILEKNVNCIIEVIKKSTLQTQSALKVQLVGNVGEKCHLASSLDSYCELSLVKSAVAGNTSGEDLSSLGNELSEFCYILVIDLGYLVLAEDANFLSSVSRTECGTLCIVSIHFR